VARGSALRRQLTCSARTEVVTGQSTRSGSIYGGPSIRPIYLLLICSVLIRSMTEIDLQPELVSSASSIW
jgi:hypothetical protein